MNMQFLNFKKLKFNFYYFISIISSIIVLTLCILLIMLHIPCMIV